MKLIKILTLSLALGTTTVSVAHADYDYDDRIEAQIYQDVNFDANVAKAVKMLEQKGYTVVDVEVDTHFGKPVLDIEARKGYVEYDIRLSYPDLRILKERADD
ncbi:PepSY domain-containing protein [Moraxella oblonga]|uniref:PepSY domain-containing protein n=1 Tax=Moraxella oblonga TaxID=200413 RepID=UPI000834B66C|nr:PepSY domain-containing protein [Moraxella oblonga]